ncbi:MAG: protein NO VEIN domain-containing protein [Clostridium sp.]|uniref:protein NO VEIN domain-containing protein n=1 Tax=Clostridium sp. TaxID=1506 RepID=UPI003F329DF0
MHYYITRGDQDNIDKSILNPINNKVFGNEKKDNMYGWAISRGSKKNIKYSKEMRENDKIIICPNGKFNSVYIGTIKGVEESEKIPESIWGNRGKAKYDFMIYIKEIEIINIKGEEFFEILEYKQIQGIQELRNDRQKMIQKILNSEKLELEIIEKKNKIIKDNIIKYWESEESLGEWDENLKQKSKQKSLKKSKNKKGRKIMSSESKQKIGLTGERIANKFIKINKKEILIKIGECDNNENEIEVNWFNEDVEVDGYSVDKDKSIGKGYDINLVSGSLNVKFEIKSSYEGKVGEITLSKNELIEMKQTLNQKNERYCIMLVSNLKGTPKIAIIDNFSKEFTIEYCKIASKHSIYINEIDNKYIF